MKCLAALLLAVAAAVSAKTIAPSTKTEATTKISNKLDFSTINLPDYAKPLTNPKDALLQEIHTLNEEIANEKKIQEEVTKNLKADAEKFKKTTSRVTSVTEPTSTTLPSTTSSGNIEKDKSLEKLLEDEDKAYNNGLDEDEEDEDDDDENYDDDGEDDDDEDDDVDIDDDESVADDLDDDEDVMTQCPMYCRCSGQYAAATTATCTKFLEHQSFGPGIAHLRIENAGEIRLGPHALRSRGLLQLESITITDTKIVMLDRTAFDDITYLFAVNLTRNGLEEIHPQLFQNSTQLSLLTISGNPLKEFQFLKSAKHYLLDAPNVAELDFSNNGIAHLPRAAFMKMQSLAYINLSNNKLKQIDKSLFDPLDALVELDISNNLIKELPIEIFEGRNLETLRISGNNFTTLAGISALKLNLLEANNNRIKVIAKGDLLGMPLLEELKIRSNEIKRIHQHAFANLTRLTTLDISNNKLTSINEHHFRTNSRLQVIYMSNNPDLRTLPVFRTTGLEYERFNVYRFECVNCGLEYLEEETFHSMNALSHLNLARNHLHGLPNGLLSELSSLRELDLSYNLIETLGEYMFKGATSLGKLSLAGNPLVTLQVTPFLMTPGLSKLDVSGCSLERVWSEARVPLKSLRFLSVRANLLKRITIEELKATPKLSGLDISQNPLDCDSDFNSAIQWLTDHNVEPKETFRYISNYEKADDYIEAKGISQWVDLAKIVCAGIPDGPPPRTLTHRPKDTFTIIDTTEESDSGVLRNSVDDSMFDHGMQSNEEVENAWATQDQEYGTIDTIKNIEIYRSTYNPGLLPVITVILITLAVILLVANFAIYLAKRRGRGPVIRPPMMLRQGLIDNKNCGLVYKPLHEEIPTPHMPKRGSFYSSSTFHYDKIVPESV
ncbi:leucine-rich repeat-containing protein 15 isoform X2 [Prorops nasuta]